MLTVGNLNQIILNSDITHWTVRYDFVSIREKPGISHTCKDWLRRLETETDSFTSCYNQELQFVVTRRHLLSGLSRQGCIIRIQFSDFTDRQ